MVWFGAISRELLLEWQYGAESRLTQIRAMHKQLKQNLGPTARESLQTDMAGELRHKCVRGIIISSELQAPSFLFKF